MQFQKSSLFLKLIRAYSSFASKVFMSNFNLHLQVKEFFIIGYGGLELEAFKHSYDWLKTSLQLAETERHTTNDKLEILDKLVQACLKVNV